MCRVLQVPRSTYYYESKVNNSTDEITPRVIEIFKSSRNMLLASVFGEILANSFP